MKAKTAILMVTDYHYPCSHAVMDHVFSKEIAKEIDVIWIMQGNNNQQKYIQWNNSLVYLIKKYTGNNKISKLGNRILWIKNLYYILQLLKRENIKRIVVRDLPLILVFLVCFKQKYELKIYYQYSAPQGDISIDRYRAKKSITRLFGYFRGKLHNYTNKYALKKAQFVFPISEYHKITIAKNNINEKKLIPLTMGIDLDWARNQPFEIDALGKLKCEYHWITYIGSLGILRQPEFMLKMIKKLYQIDKRYRLILIGDAAKPNDMKFLKNMARSMDLEKAIIFTGKLDKKALQEYLWYSDVCVSPIPPTKYYIISSPTKMYEYMGHGVPVIANREIYEQEKVINESGGGLAVNYDVEEFVKAIIHLISDKDKRFDMGKKGRQYIFENYSYKKIAETILPYLTL